MRVGIYLADLRRDRNQSHGIINYARSLARALVQTGGADDTVVVYANPAMAAELGSMTGTCAVKLRVVAAPRGPLTRLWMDHVRVVWWARRDRLDVIHFPKGFVPVMGARVPMVATVHDDIPLQYERVAASPATRLQRAYFAWLLRRTLRVATAVVTDSEYSATRLQAHRPAGASPVTVASVGVDLPEPAPPPGTGERPFLLHFGSTLPHKRSAWALAATVAYLEAKRPDLDLVVIGAVEPDVQRAYDTHPQVRCNEGVLSGAQVAGVVASARALVFTSVLEGFGLPPVEAYLLGTPAVWARATSVAEVMDGLPGGFTPDDDADLARALDEALALDEASLVAARATLTERFSWERTGRRVWGAYRGAAA
jgi:glycosyltransferase involved in cell wall biosynthesis